MAKLTTLKPSGLYYREVGSTSATAYTPLMGVLKGLNISQDEDSETTIDAEFFTTPWDIDRTSNPVTINFDLVNFDAAEIRALTGEEGSGEDLDGPTGAVSIEKEFLLTFTKGYFGFLVYKGTAGFTLNRDDDGALRLSFTITALTYTDEADKQHTWKLVAKKPEDFKTTAGE